MNLLPLLGRFFSALAEFLCPAKCRACAGSCQPTEVEQGTLHSICKYCWTEITSEKPQLSWLSANGYYVPTASGCFYRGRIKKVLYHLKYDDDTILTNDLTLLLRIGWNKLLPSIAAADAVIVPIPMHPDRERKRGYNQAELLAQKLSDVTNLPIAKHYLVRILNTAPQFGLTRKERKKNLAGAFQANELLVRGKSIILVDDIFTTGTTLSEAAHELFNRGAKLVAAVTVSRAI